MKNKTVIAVIIGALLAGSSYYIWCSWQWKKAAEAAEAPATSATGVARAPTPGEAPDTTGPGGVQAQTPPDGTPKPEGPPLHMLKEKGLLTLDARLEGAFALEGGEGTMHVAARVRAPSDANAAAQRLPANLVLVLDRSGSMTGQRIVHARAAATFLLDQLEDGDRFALITYSDQARVDVASTVVTTDTKPSIRQAIERINVGGGTCISCGLESGRQQLNLAAGQGMAGRLILLSDGQTNIGVTDPTSLAKMATEIERASTAAVSTIGVGLDYNEEIMASLARHGNGAHHFVENPATLHTTLQSELETLQRLVARNARVQFTLAPGVRFAKGYDRPFEVVGNRVLVSLGAFPAGREKTVLMKLTVPTSPGAETLPVTDLALTFDDVTSGANQRLEGALAARVTSDAAVHEGGLDPEVAARIHQSELVQAMQEANDLVRRGDFEEAERRIDQQLGASSTANEDLGNDRLTRQIDVLKKSKKKMKRQRSAAGGSSRAAKSNAADLALPAFD